METSEPCLLMFTDFGAVLVCFYFNFLCLSPSASIDSTLNGC